MLTWRSTLKMQMRCALLGLASLTSVQLVGNDEATAEVVANTQAIDLSKVDMDRVSVALGHLVARQLQMPGMSLPLAKIIDGMKEELNGQPSPMSDDELTQTMAAIEVKHQEEVAHANLAEAEAFLSKNAQEPGIVSVNPKLQYKVLKEGSGDIVAANAAPLVHYSCSLLNGTKLASSDESAKAMPFALETTLPGISQGVVGMKKGERRILYIHPELAFGTHAPLAPNALLLFEVEVVEAQSVAETCAETAAETAQAGT